MEEKMLTFEEKLDRLLETAKKKKNVLEEQEILDVFAKEELTPEKLDQSYDFLDTKKVDDLDVATKVAVLLQLTDPDLKSRDRVVKKTEKDSLYAAMDVASVWLERALANP